MILIGMIHLLPLPGAPRFGGSLAEILDRAVRDAQILTEAGFGGLLLENYGDAPFYKEAVPAHTVAIMTRAAAEIRRVSTLPLGIQVLRNDALSAIGIASAVGAEFIRVNVLSGAMLTDQGIIEGKASDVVRYRDRVSPGTRIWADVHVKHAIPLAAEKIEDAARDLERRSLADVIIVSGSGTGVETSPDEVRKVASAVSVPVAVGSGVGMRNIADLLLHATYSIVGTAIKEGGVTENPVDLDRARDLAVRIK